MSSSYPVVLDELIHKAYNDQAPKSGGSMDLEDAGKRFGELEWNTQRTAFTAPCPNDSNHKVKVTLLAGSAFCRCTNGCDAKQLKTWLNTSGEGPSESPGAQPGAFQVKGGPSPSPDPALWKLHAYRYTLDKLNEPKNLVYFAAMAEADLTEAAVSGATEALAKGHFPPSGLSETETAEEIASGCQNAVRDFLGLKPPLPVVHTNGNGKVVPYVIPFEGYDLALVANEEYLKREPVVEGLCYGAAVSMVTGGKHAGKSTLARWMAVCVAKGYSFLDRQVQQGQVLYLASEDETMVARQELIRLGWCATDPLQFLSMSNVTEEQVKFLESLTKYIGQNAVKLIVMDMLFDFAPIHDEMSYAQTREAVGSIQKVASRGNCHITTVHHAPKNAMIGDAAVAALGSQGIAARVSPLVLVRRFGPGVHSISSTEVRDPRGKSIPDSRLLRLDDGSIKLGGPFKQFMLAEVYAERVLNYLQEDPGSEATKLDVAEALDIPAAVARGCLALLYRQGVIGRNGNGTKGRPFRYFVPMTQIKTPNDPDGDSGKGTVGGTVHNPDDPDTTPDWEQQGRFGYKD